jgi:hypothetical protein
MPAARARASRDVAAHFTGCCAREYVPAVTTAPPALATTLSTSTAVTALAASC